MTDWNVSEEYAYNFIYNNFLISLKWKDRRNVLTAVLYLKGYGTMTGRTDPEAEAPILWPSHEKTPWKRP